MKSRCPERRKKGVRRPRATLQLLCFSEDPDQSQTCAQLHSAHDRFRPRKNAVSKRSQLCQHACGLLGCPSLQLHPQLSIQKHTAPESPVDISETRDSKLHDEAHSGCRSSSTSLYRWFCSELNSVHGGLRVQVLNSDHTQYPHFVVFSSHGPHRARVIQSHSGYGTSLHVQPSKLELEEPSHLSPTERVGTSSKPSHTSESSVTELFGIGLIWSRCLVISTEDFLSCPPQTALNVSN